MSNVQFGLHKVSAFPSSGMTQGHIYFNSTNKVIGVATSETSIEQYGGGKIADATFTNNVLTISFNDGTSALVLDFSDTASATQTEHILGTLRASINALAAVDDTQTASSVSIGGARKYADAAVTTAKSELIGTSGDPGTASTIYGAKAYADNLIAGLGQVLKFKGTKSTVAEIKAITTAAVGDVWLCTADSSEYVCIKAVTGTADPTAWEKLGEALQNGILYKDTNEFVDGQLLAADGTGGKVKVAVLDSTVAETGASTTMAPTTSAVRTAIDAKATSVTSALIGTSGDPGTASTIYGAKAYADSLHLWVEWTD